MFSKIFLISSKYTTFHAGIFLTPRLFEYVGVGLAKERGSSERYVATWDLYFSNMSPLYVLEVHTLTLKQRKSTITDLILAL
jgi:hypothetical protein